VAPVCPHLLEGCLDGRVGVEGRHGDAEALEAGAQLGALELPQAERDPVGRVAARAALEAR